MSGNNGMMIGMALIGAFAPWAATAIGPSLGTGLTAATGGGLTATTVAGTTGLSGMVLGLANASALTSAMTMGGLGMAMSQQPPEMPSFDQQFQYQQASMDYEQSMSRRSDQELEDVLLDGTEREKNLAFQELRVRGADEDRITELATRRERSETQQQAINEFQAANVTPTPEMLEARAAELAAARMAGFEDDLEDERKRLTQISAQRGTLDSNRNRELNMELAALAASNRADIQNAAYNTALGYQKNIEEIRNEGLNRLVKGAEFNETQNRFNVAQAETERRYQESLRQASNADQRNLAFQRFQTEQNVQLARYQAESQNVNSNAMMGLGLAGLSMTSGQPYKPSITPIPPRQVPEGMFEI